MQNKLQDPKKLKLNNLKVVFYTGPEDEKAKEFGTSITVDVTDAATRKALEDFVKENNIGKKGDPKCGVANIKEYTNEKTGETTQQFTIKFNEHTQFAGKNGLGQSDLGYGAVINLIAKAYEYTKFGGGIAMNASAVVVLSGSSSGNDADLEELLDDLGDEDTTDEASVVPF